jgi:hypothetical protein
VAAGDKSSSSGERRGPRFARSVVCEMAVRLVNVASVEGGLEGESIVTRVTSASFERASRICMFRT